MVSMNAGGIVAIIGFLIMLFAIPSSPIIALFGLFLLLIGVIYYAASKSTSPPPPPQTKTPPNAETTSSNKLEQQRNELNEIYEAYSELQKTVEELREEVKRKDEIIQKLREKIEAKEKTVSISTEAMHTKKKAPAVRLITYDTDLIVYDYVIAHEGTINLKKAAQELGTTVEEVRNAIERLKKSGKLTET